MGDKLHGEANKAMRVHGTKLFISAPQTSKNDDEDEENKTKEDEADFFEKHTEGTPNFEASRSVSLAKSVAAKSEKSNASSENSDQGAPNVEAVLYTSPNSASQAQASRKPTIGQRKPQNKKGGLGAKKTGGLGAQKVKKDFSEIEREAELADQGRQKAVEEEKTTSSKAKIEDEAQAAASMRLAYQELSLDQKKT